jgi:hypothetical protein
MMAATVQLNELIMSVPAGDTIIASDSEAMIHLADRVRFK